MSPVLRELSPSNMRDTLPPLGECSLSGTLELLWSEGSVQQAFLSFRWAAPNLVWGRNPVLLLALRGVTLISTSGEAEAAVVYPTQLIEHHIKERKCGVRDRRTPVRDPGPHR